MVVASVENTSIVISVCLLFGHIGFSGHRIEKVSKLQYLIHALYAFLEPIVLRITDFIITRKFIVETKAGGFLLWLLSPFSQLLPHGVVLSNKAAKKLLHHIEKHGKDRGAIIAVGPCVCQRSLRKYQHPTSKDIAVLYGAEIYTHLNLGYQPVTAAQAGEILDQCHQAGLVHTLDFCMQSGRWAFVVCNCDDQICIVTRCYNRTKLCLYCGPETVAFDSAKCLGMEKCGRCVEACIFHAIQASKTHPLLSETNCMGCGQCVRVCKTGAKTMRTKNNYPHKDKIPLSVLVDD